MSQLSNLFTAIKDQSLSKEQLESYHSDLTNLYAQMMFEMATLEKAEALYFLEYKNMSAPNEKVTDIAIKRAWRGIPQGQRLIEIKNYEKATTKMLSSIKNRIYSLL